MSAENHLRELPDRVVVARVRKAHGVRGEMIVAAESDVVGRFSSGNRLVACLASGETRVVTIESSRPHGDAHLVRFAGCEDRDSASLFRGAVLEVERSEVPRAPQGTYYYFELVGCVCSDSGSGELGRVTGVIEDGGGVLLELDSSAGRLLIPFVEAYLVSVDVAAGRIDLDLPQDLVETCTSTL